MTRISSPLNGAAEIFCQYSLQHLCQINKVYSFSYTTKLMGKGVNKSSQRITVNVPRYWIVCTWDLSDVTNMDVHFTPNI